MGKVQVVQKDALAEGPASPGIVRHLAFKGDGFQILRSRVAPATVSGWHQHGDYTVFGYVVYGQARFDSGPDGQDTVTLGPGDFFTVPPHTIHREINPSASEDSEIILFLRGTGATTINVEGPEPH